MTENRRASIGRRGEEMAAAFLQTKGFRILARNWHCRFGEIDLIVQRGDETRFIEVKTRSSTTFGYPEESVTAQKLEKLKRTVELWLMHHPACMRYQLDVISILAGRNSTVDLQWIEGVG